MSNKASDPGIALLIVVLLQLPFCGYAWQVASTMSPTQPITALPAMTLLILLALLVLPILVLHRLRIAWNPPRARLNEPLD